ncbi:MAG: type IV secretory system conjugative DNA transfer family protein [Litorimonas sp.]
MPVSLAVLWNEPSLFKRASYTGAGLAFVTIIGLLKFFRNRALTNLGNAQFADAHDVKKAGLRSSSGLILGKFKGQYMMDDGQTHVLVSAPTGSGKGVGIVIPNLLNWNGSAVVLDIKGENYELTSGFRHQHGQQVFVFSPFSETSHRFNPFDAINPNPRQRFNDIQNIAQIILPDNDKDPTWSQQGRALFVAFALYLLDKDGQICSVGNILRFLQTQDDTRDIVKGIMAVEGDKLDPSAQRTFSNFSQQEKRMSESVKVGLVGALSLWNSPSIDAATSHTDFDISALRKTKMTIYVVVSLADISSLRPLLTLFFEQVFAVQLRKEPGKEDKHKVLFLMDEFESLGTMDGIVDKLPFVRSFNIRIMAIIQGLSQLDQRYSVAGRDKILQGSKHQIFFASNDQQTTNYVSQTLGKTTIETVSKSRSKQGRSVSRQSQARELMLPQEVREMSPDKLILITEGTRPILGDKIKYFKDAAMKKRVGLGQTDVPTLNLDPKFAPTLEDIAGPDIAAQIRSDGKAPSGGLLGRGGQKPVKSQKTPNDDFSNLLGDLKKEK